VWRRRGPREVEPPVETPEPTVSPEPAPSPEPSEGTEEVEGSLDGSVAVGECLNDAPWIAYDVVLTGVEGDLTAHTASLVLTDGTSTETIVLGALTEDGTLSGRTLWPGASVADDGVTPTGWPGWELVDGTWVETDGNYAWTRGDLTATLVVNPEIAVDLVYPVATPNCATAPPAALTSTEVEAQVTADGVEVAVEAEEGALGEAEAQTVAAGDEELPQTGSTVLPLVLGALGLMAVGGAAIFFVRRRA
jgi:LPXTG-motif cell wall-anchored protein